MSPTTLGPLGFPQTDRQAQALDAILKALPKDDAFAYRKRAVPLAVTEVSPGERADVSFISTDDPDRQGDVVRARGMNDSQFALNPIVTFHHAYHLPPAGKSLWRKRVRSSTGGDAIKAKTVYPPRPADWPADKDWLPDVAFALAQQGLMNGKSIGFLPVKVHVPGDDERRQHGWGTAVDVVIDEWLLLEYACVFIPAQQNALVEQVSKGLLSPSAAQALGVALPPPPPAEPDAIPFVSLSAYEQALATAVARLDPLPLAEKLAAEAVARRMGRV